MGGHRRGRAHPLLERVPVGRAGRDGAAPQARHLDGWGDYPRKHAEADFHRVLRFEDEIDVRVSPERLGRTSITWRFEITRDGELCVEGRLVVVHVGDDGRPTPLTERERAALGG